MTARGSAQQQWSKFPPVWEVVFLSVRHLAQLGEVCRRCFLRRSGNQPFHHVGPGRIETNCSTLFGYSTFAFIQDTSTESCFPPPLHHRLVAVSFRRRLEAARLVPVLGARIFSRKRKCRFPLAVAVFDGILPAKPRQANRNAPSPELPAEITAP